MQSTRLHNIYSNSAAGSFEPAEPQQRFVEFTGWFTSRFNPLRAAIRFTCSAWTPGCQQRDVHVSFSIMRFCIPEQTMNVTPHVSQWSGKVHRSLTLKDGWTDGWTDGWMIERLIGYIDGWTNEQTDDGLFTKWTMEW